MNVCASCNSSKTLVRLKQQNLALCPDCLVKCGKIKTNYGLGHDTPTKMVTIASAIARMPVSTNDMNESHARTIARMFSGQMGLMIFMLEHPSFVTGKTWEWRFKLTTATESPEFWEVMDILTTEAELNKLKTSLPEPAILPEVEAK